MGKQTKQTDQNEKKLDFLRIEGETFRYLTISNDAKILLSYHIFRGKHYRLIKTIAEDLRMNITAIYRAHVELKRAGYLTIESMRMGRSFCNHYSIKFDQLPEPLQEKLKERNSTVQDDRLKKIQSVKNDNSIGQIEGQKQSNDPETNEKSLAKRTIKRTKEKNSISLEGNAALPGETFAPRAKPTDEEMLKAKRNQYLLLAEKHCSLWGECPNKRFCLTCTKTDVDFRRFIQREEREEMIKQGGGFCCGQEDSFDLLSHEEEQRAMDLIAKVQEDQYALWAAKINLCEKCPKFPRWSPKQMYHCQTVLDHLEEYRANYRKELKE